MSAFLRIDSIVFLPQEDAAEIERILIAYDQDSMTDEDRFRLNKLIEQNLPLMIQEVEGVKLFYGTEEERAEHESRSYNLPDFRFKGLD